MKETDMLVVSLRGLNLGFADIKQLLDEVEHDIMNYK